MTASCTQRTQNALAAIAAADDEGRRIFTRVYPDAALQAARAADERAALGISLGPLDGCVVSIKDLFDVAGEPTTAGSALLRASAPAVHDAAIVQRLRAGGAVIIGKTGMTEFAFSGIGINPHYGTPGNARDATRIPGGSSSGAGVSVARAMAEVAIGSDTGGSVRIPAALNGVVGFKPTQARVSRQGAVPLSYTLDTVGPLATSVRACALADAVLSGTPWQEPTPRALAGLRLGVPRGLLLADLDAATGQAFDATLAALAHAGARLQDLALDDWLGAPQRLQEDGSISAAEAAWTHRALLAQHADAMDPMVLARMRRGQGIAAAHYVGVLQERARLQQELDAQLQGLDLLLLPTVPCVAPAIADLADPGAFARANALMLRNPSVFNFYDLPALSLPMRRTPSALPTGLMLVGRRGQDAELLALGMALEQVV